MTEETVGIRPADAFALESLRLIEQLWSELGTLYPEVNGPPFPPKDIVGAALFLCWPGRWPRVIGCEALRQLPSGDFSIDAGVTCEVPRCARDGTFCVLRYRALATQRRIGNNDV